MRLVDEVFLILHHDGCRLDVIDGGDFIVKRFARACLFLLVNVSLVNYLVCSVDTWLVGACVRRWATIGQQVVHFCINMACGG